MRTETRPSAENSPILAWRSCSQRLPQPSRSWFGKTPRWQRQSVCSHWGWGAVWQSRRGSTGGTARRPAGYAPSTKSGPSSPTAAARGSHRADKRKEPSPTPRGRSSEFCDLHFGRVAEWLGEQGLPAHGLTMNLYHMDEYRETDLDVGHDAVLDAGEAGAQDEARRARNLGDPVARSGSTQARRSAPSGTNRRAPSCAPCSCSPGRWHVPDRR